MFLLFRPRASCARPRVVTSCRQPAAPTTTCGAPATAPDARTSAVRCSGYAASSCYEPPPRCDVPTLGLRRGMCGEQVRLLQEALIKLGCMTRAQACTGPGQFGPRTECALKAFQRDNQLCDNGCYGDDDRIALTGALSRCDATRCDANRCPTGADPVAIGARIWRFLTTTFARR